MAESSYDKIAEIADYLKLSISAEEIAGCFTKLNMSQEEIEKAADFFADGRKNAEKDAREKRRQW